MASDEHARQTLHEWFEADGFRVGTEKYGTVDLYVAASGDVEREVYVRGDREGDRWGFPLEGDCGEDGYRSFNGVLTQTTDEDTPILSIAEMVAEDEWEDIDHSIQEVLFDGG